MTPEPMPRWFPAVFHLLITLLGLHLLTGDLALAAVGALPGLGYDLWVLQRRSAQGPHG